MEKRGRFVSASVRGANHAGKGMPCQDAAMSAALYHKGYLFHFMAVADGHGGAAYTRSDIGSFLSLQAASESVNRFIMFVIDVYEKYPDNWIELVKEDFSARFGKMLVNNWVRMVEAHANDAGTEGDETIKLYGTTVSVALVFNGYLFAGRIGDSSVFALANQNRRTEAKDLFEADEFENATPGLSTASLCSRDAYRKWQVCSCSLDDIQLLLLATDGFTDSLKDPKGMVLDFYRHIARKGIAKFEQTINMELERITQKGVGDDISLVIFLPEKTSGAPWWLSISGDFQAD